MRHQEIPVHQLSIPNRFRLMFGQPLFPEASTKPLSRGPLKAGDEVICIDDGGYLIPDPGFEHLSPVKGLTYRVREYLLVGGVGAISVMEGNPEHFFRACRFRRATAP